MSLIVIDHFKCAPDAEEAEHIEYYSDYVAEFLDYRQTVFGPEHYAHELNEMHSENRCVQVYYHPFPLCNDRHDTY